MLTSIALAAAVAASSFGWELRLSDLEGEPVCEIATRFDDGAKASFFAMESTWQEGMFVAQASDPRWSISQGEELGLVTFSAPDYQFGGSPMAGNHGLYLMASLEALEPFLDSAAEHGFTISRDGKGKVEDYGPSNLHAAYEELASCMDENFVPPPVSDDPFAH